ncbi:MAG: hypothetical protein U0X20_23675 [Caldilineaceae bacterium]
MNGQQMMIEVETLRAENRRLRRLTKNGKQGRILHRAAADAKQLVGWRFAGYSVSRRNVESYGMSRRRWIWAIGLLRVARVLDTDSDVADRFLLETIDECLAAIERAVNIVEQGGIERLIVRMPRGTVLPPRAR